MLMSKDFIFIKLMDANQNEEFIIEEEEMVDKTNLRQVVLQKLNKKTTYEAWEANLSR